MATSDGWFPLDRVALLRDTDNLKVKTEGDRSVHVDWTKLLEHMDARRLLCAMCFLSNKQFPKGVSES